MKTKVYLWTNNVQIIPMSSTKANAKPLDSIENVSNVMRNMLPGSDVDAMCNALVSAVRISESLHESDYELSSRLSQELMRHATNHE